MTGKDFEYKLQIKNESFTVEPLRLYKDGDKNTFE